MIRYACSLVALAVGLGLGFLSVLPSAAAEDPDSQRIARLIAQLGAGTFREREEASRALEAIGAPALEALRPAAQTTDPEVRRRAEELVRKLSQPGERAKLLAPLRLQLKYQDTPVEQAVKDLAKQSGYPISLASNKAKLAGRRVTLRTGETTFWEAFDQLCRQAGLVEEDPASKPAPGGMGLKPAGLPGPGGAPAPPPGFPPPGAPPPGALPVPPAFGEAKLVLVDGKSPVRPTCYAGAMRIRALPSPAKRAGEIQVTLEAAPEPRMQWYRPGTPHIDQAVDDRGQALSQAAAAPAARPGMGGIGFGRLDYRQVTVRLQAADKPSKVLKVLRGTVTGEVQTPLGELLEVKQILKATGQTVKGKDGTSLEVLQAGRQKDGTIQLQVKLTAPADIVSAVSEQDVAIPFAHRPPGFNPGPPPRGTALPNFTGFALVDDKGQSLPLTEAKRSPGATGDSVTHTLTFRPKKGQGNPVRLRFTGARVTTIAVPFTLRDVPLP